MAFFVWVVSVVGIYVKKTCTMGCNFVIFLFLNFFVVCTYMYIILCGVTRETCVIVCGTVKCVHM